MEKNSRILWLDVARVVAIISISLNHAVNRTYDNYIDTALEFNSSSVYSTCLKAGVSVFSRLGVPIFLMISGVLLLNKSFESESDIKRFYGHNLLRLLITSEIWFFIMFWIYALFNPQYQYLIENIKNGEGIKTVIALIKTLLFIDPITFGNMWYIPMILCIYTLIPVVAVFLKKHKSKLMLIPLFICTISAFIIPNINATMNIFGVEKQYDFTLSSTNLFSLFYLYVLVGYMINQGIFTGISTRMIIFLTLFFMAIDTLYQTWAYAGPTNYLVSYDFVGILICSAFLFELIRRKSQIIERISGGCNTYQEFLLEFSFCMRS